MLGYIVPLPKIRSWYPGKANFSISILIPCYNEEVSLEQTIQACLDQTYPVDEIIIVDDGSKDHSRDILKHYSSHIQPVLLPKNMGNKSLVQQEGLKLVSTDLFLATDGDTLLDREFVAQAVNHFIDPDVVALGGYVKSLKYNLITACRELDYTVCQDIHKQGQAILGAIFVIPGCAGVFRTSFFKEHITFDHDTITEDLDFTYKIYKMGKKIVYEPNCIVYTQDPPTFGSYVNQLRRWAGGGWQNLRKHHDIIGVRWQHAVELSLMYVEGFAFSLMLFVIPLINLPLFGYFVLSHLAVGLMFGLYAAIKRQRLDLLLCFPLYVFLGYVNAYIFLEQFTKEIVFRQKNMVWFHPERKVMS
jgi:biofilm PGA synthesis N-glycosyltransferase PgaC